MALTFKLSVLKRTHNCMPLNVQIHLNDAFLLGILLDPPKKAQGYERSRYGFMHKYLSIPAARNLDIY